VGGRRGFVPVLPWLARAAPTADGVALVDGRNVELCKHGGRAGEGTRNQKRGLRGHCRRGADLTMSGVIEEADPMQLTATMVTAASHGCHQRSGFSPSAHLPVPSAAVHPWAPLERVQRGIRPCRSWGGRSWSLVDARRWHTRSSRGSPRQS
jgi:hypothetical protein